MTETLKKSTIALSVHHKKWLRSYGVPDQSYDELIHILLERLKMYQQQGLIK